jgi:hypothetical protein
MRNIKTTINILLMIFTVTNLCSQTWVGSHTTVAPDYFTTENTRPNPASFYDMMGFCGGTNWDGHSSPNPAKNVVRNARSFHLMEIDYRYQANPSNYDVVACTTDCDDWSCYPDSGCDLPVEGSGESSFAYYKSRYCGKWKTNFDTLYASLEAITPYYKNGNCPSTEYEWRGWPHKWYNAQEWGGDEESIRENARKYAEAFVITFCPKEEDRECIVNVLEVGNEPWGDPGVPAFHAIQRGVIDAMKDYYESDDPQDWRMKLSTAAFQADDPNSSINDYIDYMIPTDIRQYYSYISIHPYAFHITGNRITETPEAAQGEFLRIKNLEEWRRQNMPHAMMNVTEFGWNSKDLGNDFPGVGEAAQAVYTIRASLLMSRYQVNKAFIYELFDQPGVTLFNSTGLIGRNNNPVKKGFHALSKFQEQVGDKVFLKALHEDYDPENGMIVYLLGDKNGQPTHLVAWRPTDINNISNYPTDYLQRTITLPSNNMQVQSNGQFRCLGWDNSADGNISAQTMVELDPAMQHQLKVKLTAMPILIPLVADGIRYNKQGQLEEFDSDCGQFANGGEIDGFEAQCEPFDPEMIYSMDAPVAEPVDVDYQWERSFNANTGTWEVIEGAVEAEYDPGFIEESCWFRRGTRLDGCTLVSYSNPIEKRVGGNDCGDEPGDTGPDDPIFIECIADISLTANESGWAQASWNTPVATTTCSVSDNPVCTGEEKEGFEYAGNLEGKEYYVSNNKKQWSSAKEECAAIGGQLVQLKDELENEFVQDAMSISGVSTAYIGLSDESSDGQYQWTDGTNATYENWSGNAPNANGQTDFAYMGNWSGGKWYKGSFWTTKNYVCEITCSAPADQSDNELTITQVEGPENGSQLSPGNYVVIYEVSNACGDIAQCSFEIHVESPQDCPEETMEGFISLGDFNNHQYQLSEDKSRWLDALQTCDDQGGYLTIVDDTAENEFLTEVIKSHSVSTAYIGLTDIAGDGSFLWSNGAHIDYENWSQSPSMNDQADFVYLGAWTDGPWYLAGQYTEKQFVCEFSCEDLPEIAGLQASEQNIGVYPNPVRDELQIVLDNGGFEGYWLTDLSGKILNTQVFDAPQPSYALNLSQFTNGMYLLILEGEEIGRKSFKIVKK